MPSQFSWQKSLLLRCKILVLFVKTLPADEKYPALNIHSLMIPIQMQLPKQQKSFSQFFSPFLKSRSNFKHFFFSKLQTLKTWSDKCLKSPVSEDPSTSSMVNVPSHFWNLRQSTFVIFIDQCQGSWVGKIFNYWHAKSWDCLLTHWLPMKSILFLIETI